MQLFLYIFQRKLYRGNNIDLTWINDDSFLFLVGGIYLGILLGVLFSLMVRVHSHRIIARLTEHSADDRESAATLGELGLGKSCMARRLLKAGGTLRRMVLVANETEFAERKVSPLRRFWRKRILNDPLPAYTDFSVARFYIPEENRISAELRFTKEPHPVRSFLLAFLGLTALAVFTILVLPELLTMVDNLIPELTPRSQFY